MVDNLEGSAFAKKRVRVVLETITGAKTIDEACEELGIERTRLYELRDELLVRMIESAEPGRPGRPRRQQEELVKADEVLEENRRLARENQVLRAREEMALIQGAIGGKKKWRTRGGTAGRRSD